MGGAAAPMDVPMRKGLARNAEAIASAFLVAIAVTSGVKALGATSADDGINGTQVGENPAAPCAASRRSRIAS
jgi:hypothetical protein